MTAGNALRYGTDLVVGMVAGAAGDLLVETFNIPFFNDVPRFGAPGKDLSNAEMGGYAVSLFLIGAGGFALLTGRRIMGVSPDMFFWGAGLGYGIQSYETWLSEWLGIRKQMVIPAQ